MESFDSKKIAALLTSIQSGQPFTIEELVRKHGESQGALWAGVFEIEAVENIRKYLMENDLIKEYGTTKLYTKS